MLACYNPRMDALPQELSEEPQDEALDSDLESRPESDPDPLHGQASMPEPDPPDEGDEFIRLKRSHVYSLLLPLAFAAGLGAGYLFWGRSGPANPPTVAQAGVVGAAGAPHRIDVELGGAPSLGPSDAPVTVVEFSDFNCPYCREWHLTTFETLKAAYPDQIRFVYRDLPILSQESFLAAIASHCAGEQGAYWEFHDALFSGGLPLGREAYLQYAIGLNLDADALLRCLDEGRYAQRVEESAQYATQLGITGTPTFFINGIPVVGNQPLHQFTEIIEAELD